MFSEENAVEEMVFDTPCGGVTLNTVAEELASHSGACNRNQGGLLHGI